MPGNPSFLIRPIFKCSDVGRHFTDNAIIAAMVDVEVALAGAQARCGIVPTPVADRIAALPGRFQISSGDLANGVETSGVPIAALLGAMRAQLDPDAADWLHFGATSQDILDTAFSVAYAAALADIEGQLTQSLDRLNTLSDQHQATLMLGRTRGQLATPITFGLRVAQWAQPMIRVEKRAEVLKIEALRVQLGGASGSCNVLGAKAAEVRKDMAESLGLQASPPWHTDRSGLRVLSGWLSEIVFAGAKIGADVVVSARGEIAELRLTDAGPSSAMPHKANPVVAEALQSLAAIAAACEAGLAAGAIHGEERDGANWSVEWMLLPQLFEAAGSTLAHLNRFLDTLTVDVNTMRARIDSTPEVVAEVATQVISSKVGRAEASRLVAEALAAQGSFKDALPKTLGIDWDAALADRVFAEPAALTAKQIFASRSSDATDRP